MPDGDDGITFHIDHVMAVQHGGTGSIENLAYCCGSCNLHKGPNLSSVDPTTRRRVWLYSPREDSWDRHFRWAGPVLLGRTARGRATVTLLAINDSGNVATRSALMSEGRF